MSKLQNLLLGKKITEDAISELKNRFSLLQNFDKAIREKLNSKNLDEYEKSKLNIELINNEWEGKKVAETLKAKLSVYDTYFIQEIEKEIKTSKIKPINKIEWLELEKETDALKEYELWGKSAKMPATEEHPFVIEDYKKQILNLENIIHFGMKKHSSEKDEYQKALLEKEVFDAKIHLRTLTKRMNSRIEYYNNQFLPTYKIQLAEAKKYVESFKERAELVFKYTADVPLKMMLDKYSEHVKEDEKLWLFYTALKDRVLKSISFILENKKDFPNWENLTSQIIPQTDEKQ